ncbi:hypothetical protein CEXT_202951, partial [Caerostris extrusa]
MQELQILFTFFPHNPDEAQKTLLRLNVRAIFDCKRCQRSDKLVSDEAQRKRCSWEPQKETGGNSGWEERRRSSGRKLPLAEFTKECVTTPVGSKQDCKTNLSKEDGPSVSMCSEELAVNTVPCSNEYGEYTD